MGTAAEVGILVLLILLLVAYGFFWKANRDEFDDGDLRSSDIASLDNSTAYEKANKLQRARVASVILGAAPLLIVFACASVAVSLSEKIDSDAAFSPVRAGILLVLVIWAALGIVMAVKCVLAWRVGDLLREKVRTG